MPETAIKFGFYEVSSYSDMFLLTPQGMKRVCARMEGHNNPKQNSTASKLIAGAVGGMASQ
jgi:hypothetical protein